MKVSIFSQPIIINELLAQYTIYNCADIAFFISILLEKVGLFDKTHVFIIRSRLN